MNKWMMLLTLASALAAAGCLADHHIGDGLPITNGGDDMAAAPSIPGDVVWLETNGMTFQVGCPQQSFGSGATCGTAATGNGPIFDSLNCPNTPHDALPVYVLGVFFRNFNPSSGIAGDTTFDLSDPGHEQYVTVMFNYQDTTGTEYHYCTAPPLGDGGTAASSGTVVVHQFAPQAAPVPPGDYASDVEITNAVIPTSNGGPPFKVVSAHLYF